MRTLILRPPYRHPARRVVPRVPSPDHAQKIPDRALWRWRTGGPRLVARPHGTRRPRRQVRSQAPG